MSQSRDAKVADIERLQKKVNGDHIHVHMGVTCMSCWCHMGFTSVSHGYHVGSIDMLRGGVWTHKILLSNVIYL